MFETTHFIWLGISVIIIISLLIITSKFKIPFEKVLTLMIIVSIISELTKIFNNMEPGLKGGMFLEVQGLPFHLCTLQIFFFFALKFFVKKESTKQILLCFMLPTMCLGGVIALFIPTCGTEFNLVQPYQYFLFHTFIVFFAIYIIKNHLCVLDFKAYVRNLGLFVMLIILEMWINSALSFAGTNFLYITRPPMENLPILNLKYGWTVYFVHLISIGFIFLSLFQLPFILHERKLKKQNNI